MSSVKKIIYQTSVLLCRKTLFLVLSAFTLTGTLQAQQEPMYSQYMFNMLNINPAYAGNRASDNITALYRNQWVGFDGAPRTGTLSWDRRNEDSNVGYGLQMYDDRLGIERTTGVQAFYSYHLPFENSFLAFGLSGGVLNYRANYSEVSTIRGGDPVFQDDVNGWLPTAGFGVLYASEYWYLGLSVPALLHTKINAINYLNQNNFGANNHYFLTGGYTFDISDNVKLKPSALLKAVKGAPLQCDFSMNAWFNNVLGVGVSYRTGDALVGSIEFQLLPELRLGYAYDYTLSDLKNYNRGTHEIMLRLELKSDHNGLILSPRYY
jgi:type IX secretion system PorP/SprF family membrane protein